MDWEFDEKLRKEFFFLSYIPMTLKKVKVIQNMFRDQLWLLSYRAGEMSVCKSLKQENIKSCLPVFPFFFGQNHFQESIPLVHQ